MLVTARAMGYAVVAAHWLQPVLRDRTFVFCRELRSVYTSCPHLSTWQESFIAFNYWTFELRWTIDQRPEAENFEQREPSAHPFTWYDIFLNCNWLATRWQYYSTHLHANNTQNGKTQTIHRTTQKYWKFSAGRGPSFRVLPWHLPYNWGKSTEELVTGTVRHSRRPRHTTS
jgi:hypothetical protein